MAHDSLVVAGPRRRWPHRLLIGLNVLVAICLVATAGAYGYIRFRFGQIDKLALGEVLRNRGNDDPGAPMNVLLVGSDSRKNISAEERKAFGTERQVGGERSDTILILHVDPREQKAAILSVPRDLYVTIAGTERRARINSAFEGGPERLIATIRSELGIQIDHYAQVDFNGFRGIVDAIGGVEMYFAAPARDAVTGLNVTRAGCVHLDGDDALKFVRSRHYQQYESGRWRTDPTGDIGRIDRQQDFIRRVIRKASRAARNPLTLNALLDKAVRNLKIDDAFSTKDMRRLAARFRSLDPETVELLSLPATEARVGGAAVLRLDQPEAQQIIDRFTGRAAEQEGQQGEAPPPVPPGTVRVRVLNGTGAGGQASETAAALTKANFRVAGTGDADTFTYERTTIRHAPGQVDKARLLAAYLSGGARLVADPNVRDVDAVLVTGTDFDGIRSPASAATSSTTSSSAPPATPGTKPATKGARSDVAC